MLFDDVQLLFLHHVGHIERGAAAVCALIVSFR